MKRPSKKKPANVPDPLFAALYEWDRIARARETLGIPATRAPTSERQADLDRALHGIEWLAMSARVFADPHSTVGNLRAAKQLLGKMLLPLTRGRRMNDHAAMMLVGAIEKAAKNMVNAESRSGEAAALPAFQAFRLEWPHEGAKLDADLFRKAAEAWAEATKGGTAPKWQPVCAVLASAGLLEYRTTDLMKLKQNSARAVEAAWKRFRKGDSLRNYLSGD